MKLLIIGASGLVGSHVQGEVINRGHQAKGTYRSYARPELLALDLADRATVQKVLDDYKPDAVVHAAGWTWVDGCEKEPERAQRENVEQPTYLAQMCFNRGARFVYFSTSYVFDGSAGPYTENDLPRPINTYGRTKLMGEQAVLQATGGQALVPRIICVWGHESQRKNFVYQVVAAIKGGKSIRIPSDQCGNPTWAGDIAAWVLDLLQAGESGIWNLAGEHSRWNRKQWLDAILNGLRRHGAISRELEQWTYTAITTEQLTQPALRPLQAGLCTDRIRQRFPRRTREPDNIEIIF